MDITDIIKGNVHFIKNGSGDIWDEENNHIADARSWGRLQYKENGVEQHDFLTAFITDAINEKLERSKRGIVLISGGEIDAIQRAVDFIESQKGSITVVKPDIVDPPVPPKMIELQIHALPEFDLPKLHITKPGGKRKGRNFGSPKKYF